MRAGNPPLTPPLRGPRYITLSHDFLDPAGFAVCVMDREIFEMLKWINTTVRELLANHSILDARLKKVEEWVNSENWDRIPKFVSEDD